MSLIAELTLRGPLLFAETFERAPDARCLFEDVHTVTDGAGNAHYVFFWWTEGCGFETFERALEADSTVREWRRVADADGRLLHRIATVQFPPSQPLVYPTFREYGITSLESRRDADGLHLRARVPDRQTLHAFVEVGGEIAASVDVVGLYADEPSSDAESEDPLTAKQREALSRASERGYFETPSRTTLAELAEEFDVTPQTLSGHVRVGVRKLVEEAVDSPSDGD